MSNLSQLVSIYLQILLQHIVPICMLTAFMGLVMYLAGALINRIALTSIAQGQPVTWPYRPLSLSFQIAGVMVLIICFVLLFLLGAYEPFIDLFRRS